MLKKQLPLFARFRVHLTHEGTLARGSDSLAIVLLEHICAANLFLQIFGALSRWFLYFLWLKVHPIPYEIIYRKNIYEIVYLLLQK